LHHFTYQQFEPLLQRALNQRLLTVSIGVAILCVTMAWAMSGRLGFSLMPRVESDQVQATVTLPIGSHISVSRELSQQLLDAAAQLSEQEETLTFNSTRSISRRKAWMPGLLLALPRSGGISLGIC